MDQRGEPQFKESRSLFEHTCAQCMVGSYASLSVCLSVCLSVWVYPGHIIHHFNGIWATCAPGRRNMHHSGAICTTVHKGDYVFGKIQGTLMIFCFGGSYLREYFIFKPQRFHAGCKIALVIVVTGRAHCQRQVAFLDNFSCQVIIYFWGIRHILDTCTVVFKWDVFLFIINFEVKKPSDVW